MSAPEPPSDLLDQFVNVLAHEQVRMLWKLGYVAGTEAKPVKRRAGAIELAMRKDLKTVGDLSEASRFTLAAMAMVLARQIDRQAESASSSTLAKLVQELRALMNALRRVDNDDDDTEEFVRRMQTPVRDGAESGSGDAGRADGGGGRAAGPADDAPSAVHGRRRVGAGS
jgi:CRISPR/Cas system CSM-associated protein Csm2 small subunit